MKTLEEIIQRSVCLLCFVDRSSLEKKVVGGISHPLQEREAQRNIIIRWLNEKEYYEHLTDIERKAIETPVVRKTNNEILYMHNDFECIEPMLWVIGLVPKLSDYNEFVLSNLHTPLKIGANHTLSALAKRCKMRSVDQIEEKRELAMLWYWRCLEARNPSSEINDLLSAVTEIFGDRHRDLLRHYKGFDVKIGDFIVNGKPVSALRGEQLAKLEVISERRFYAFEWMCSEYDWGSVSLSC